MVAKLRSLKLFFIAGCWCFFPLGFGPHVLRLTNDFFFLWLRLGFGLLGRNLTCARLLARGPTVQEAHGTRDTLLLSFFHTYITPT